MMELRYASISLEKPVVIAVVGTDDEWVNTEVSVISVIMEIMVAVRR